MIGTQTNIDEQISLLTEPELRAIEMKYEGYNCKEIAEELKISNITPRHWFMKNGRLYDYYNAYAKEQTEIRKKEAGDTFKAHLNNAVRVLVAVMNKSKLDIARIQAAKEIINRQLGEPVKPIALADGDRVNEYLEAIRQLELNETIPADVSSGANPNTPQS